MMLTARHARNVYSFLGLTVLAAVCSFAAALFTLGPRQSKMAQTEAVLSVPLRIATDLSSCIWMPGLISAHKPVSVSFERVGIAPTLDNLTHLKGLYVRAARRTYTFFDVARGICSR